MKVLIFVFTLFFNISSASDDEYSDVHIADPVKKPDHVLKPYVRRIQKFHITSSHDFEPHSISVITYPLLTQEDSLDNFSQKLDKSFFSSYSMKVILPSLICSLVGGVVPHPSCGYVIDNIGNFLKIPISSLESKFLISWITISTTPVFMVQSYNLGKKFFSFLCHEKKFKSSQGSEKDTDPYFIQWDIKHYLAKGFLVASASINALIPLILMKDAEKEYLLFFQITALPFYIAWFENYYKVGSYNIDYLFRFYLYTVKSNFEKREILKKKILIFKECVNQNDSLSEDIYDLILKRKNSYFPIEEGAPFALSLLFCRDYARLDTDSLLDESEDYGKVSYFLNFKKDFDSNSHSIFDDIVQWASPFITGAGFYSRYCINEYLLEMFFKEMGLPADASLIAGTTFAAFEVFYKASMTNYTQQSYLKSWKDIFKKKGNFSYVRKGLNASSFINGALFSLPNLVAGFEVFKDYNVLTQVAYLTPQFLMDFCYYDSFFSRQYQNFFTKVSSFREKGIGVIGKRAHLNSYADRLYKEIDKFDFETIEKIYQITQKGL